MAKKRKLTMLKADQPVPLKDLVSGKRIYANYKGKDHTAVVLRSERVRLNGKLFNSPSRAAKAIRGGATNGWRFWKIKHAGELMPLSTLKK